MGKISEFIHHHYRHFNARALIDAAELTGATSSRAGRCS